MLPSPPHQAFDGFAEIAVDIRNRGPGSQLLAPELGDGFAGPMFGSAVLSAY